MTRFNMMNPRKKQVNMLSKFQLYILIFAVKAASHWSFSACVSHCNSRVRFPFFSCPVNSVNCSHVRRQRRWQEFAWSTMPHCSQCTAKSCDPIHSLQCSQVLANLSGRNGAVEGKPPTK